MRKCHDGTHDGRDEDRGHDPSGWPGERPVVAALLAVLAILWQGATAGGILMRNRMSLELHEVGAIAVHVLTGLTAVAALLLWRTAHTSLWPTVLAAIVFVQAALGDYETM
jgi:hypothetical protein